MPSLDTPTARSRWLVLIAASWAEGAFAAIFWGLPVLAPALRAHFHLSLSQIGVALGSINFGLLVTLFVWGIVADRIGERPVLVAGLVGISVAIVAAAFARRFDFFVAALIVAGMSGGSVTAAGGRAVFFAFRSQRGLALGIRQMATPLGAILAAFLLPLLDASLGLRSTLIALAFPCFFAAVAAFLLLARPANSRRQTGPRSAPHPGRDRRIWELSAGSGLLVVSQLAIISFAVVFLREVRGFSTGQAAAVLAGILGVGALIRLAFGYWSDRIGGPMRLLRWLSLAIAASLVAVASAAHAPAGVLVSVLVLAGGLGLGWNGLSFAAVGELAALGDSGAAVGLQQSALNAAGALAPLLFAVVVGETSWAVAFLVTGAFPLFAYFIFMRLSSSSAVLPALPLPRA